LFIPQSSEANLIIGLVVFACSFTLLHIIARLSYHSIIIGPIRRRLQFALSSIVIDEWKVSLDIRGDGSATVIHDFTGRINFGKNRWIVIGIHCDSEQGKGSDLGMEVTNIDTNRAVIPEFLLDFPTYKRVKIYFDSVLERGDEFHYKVKYNLTATFFFDREDYYMQSATHYEKKISIYAKFPPNVSVERAWSAIITDQGDSWGRHKQPVFGSDFVSWTIDTASARNKHYIRWITRTKTSTLGSEKSQKS